jgi:hypothetical protein
MQFAIAGFLKPGAEGELIKHSADFNEHIGPSATNVILAGTRKGNGLAISRFSKVTRS